MDDAERCEGAKTYLGGDDVRCTRRAVATVNDHLGMPTKVCKAHQQKAERSGRWGKNDLEHYSRFAKVP